MAAPPPFSSSLGGGVIGRVENPMNTNDNVTDADREDRATMFRLYQERGAMTDKELVAAGISLESQARNAAPVAEMIRLHEMAEAA